MDEFVKTRSAGPGAFGYEAAGLRWLAAAGRTDGAPSDERSHGRGCASSRTAARQTGDDGAEATAPVVQVLGVTEHRLTLERLAGPAPDPAAARLFGQRLARTHDAGAARFGAVPDGWDGPLYIGAAPLPEGDAPTWGAFYAARRVLPFARQAHAQGSLAPDGLRQIERVADRLARGDFDDDAPPARLHGDLWSGNVIPGPRGLTLIDPAAQGGHRVTDLAMLALFGAPHLDAILAGYESASTHLPSRWRDLIGLHQLHPLLVHAVLFGGSYGARAAAVARRYG